MPPIRGGQASPTSPPYPPRAVHSKQRSPSDVVSPSEHASANNKASDENGDSLASEGKGEVQKQQKACVHCRKSKVKCVHEGGPPCRRCRDANIECKFRLRADDENWREKTDETLSKLSNAVDVLLNRGAASPSILNGNGGSPHHPYHYSAANHSNNPPGFPSMPPPALPFGGHRARSSTLQSQFGGNAGIGSVSKASPHSDHSGAFDETSPALSGANGSTFAGRAIAGPSSVGTGAGSPIDSTARAPFDHRRRSSSRSGDVLGADASQHPLPPPSPGRAGPSRWQSTAIPAPMPFSSGLSPVVLDATQMTGASSLQSVGYNSAPFYLTNPLPMRWTSGYSSKETYGAPVAYIGRDDPRLTCISRGMLPLEKGRQLFMFFAERMQPHSFGFPTFPPTENMTPLIIAAITTVASLHEPTCRQHHGLLKADVLAAIPNHDIVEGRPLDPELGIGVEEITAACIASTWLGGEEGFTLARLARWWTLEYLRHYDLNTPGPSGNRALTLGEALTILPPYRNIDHSVKLRLWLESYIVDAQQCFMRGREPMAAGQSVSQYCESLRSSYSSRSSSSGGSGPGNGPVRLSQPDRQLVGHAAILEILTEARRAEERFEYNEANSNGHLTGGAHEDVIRERLTQILCHMEAADQWKERCREDEDMSAATPSSMDLTFIYALTRAYIGSGALSLPSTYVGTSPGGTVMGHHSSCTSSQVSVVSWAKEAALAALELACEKKGRGFGDRMVAMPTWYHFLLSHVVGFLLQLIQRKYRFLLAREARTILSTVETFVQLYIFEINSHIYQAPSAMYLGPLNAETGEPTCRPPPPGAGRHPASGGAELMARALAHVKAQSKG